MQTVLVVDDDPSVRELLAVILEAEGFTVFRASSGREALAVTRAFHVDLVTVDLMMPDMDGWELSRRLRADPATARIRQMIVSAAPLLRHGDTDDGPLHVDAVLTKPFDFAAFTEVLYELMRRPGDTFPRQQREQLQDVLSQRLITPSFQPIVDLATGEVMGVEALARGPVEGLHTPAQLFAAAHEAGLLHELDVLCRWSAITAARDAALTPPLVFVNVEPGTVHLPMSPELLELLTSDLPFQVVVEFTERALTRRMPALLRHAEEIRARGNIVALDDLGVDPRSVAVLPLLQPEIVKLDMSLLAPSPSRTVISTAVAVAAYAERSGAVVIAEGIETEEQRAIAVSLGAQWGQGWLFGRPGPLAELTGQRVSRARPALPRRDPPPAAGVTPFDLVTSDGRLPRRGAAPLLLGISRHLEEQGLALGDVAVLLSALDDARDFAGETRAAYGEVARRAALVGVLGRHLADEPPPGVYGVVLADDDPLVHEWVLVVLGPYDAALLCARLVEGDPSTDGNVHYDFVLSHDRELADRVARLLSRRLTPRRALARTTALGRVERSD